MPLLLSWRPAGMAQQRAFPTRSRRDDRSGLLRQNESRFTKLAVRRILNQATPKRRICCCCGLMPAGGPAKRRLLDNTMTKRTPGNETAVKHVLEGWSSARYGSALSRRRTIGAPCAAACPAFSSACGSLSRLRQNSVFECPDFPAHLRHRQVRRQPGLARSGASARWCPSAGSEVRYWP